MRILITPFPWAPHYQPVVPLARAALLAGHEVLVATSPAMLDVVARSGVPVTAVGGDLDEAFRAAGITFDPPKGDTPHSVGGSRDWPADWPAHPETLTDSQREYFARIGVFSSVIAQAQLPDLFALARRWRPDVVVHDGTQFAGPLLAQALDLPNARYLLGYPGRLRVDTCYGPDPVPALVALHERFAVRMRLEPTVWLDPCPPSMQYPAPDATPVLPIRYVPYNGGAELPTWLHAPPERPRVYVTWGHTTGEWEGATIAAFVRQTVEATAALDVEPVLALSPTLRALLPDLPAGVRSVDGLPTSAVLPTCAAAVHHAGPGTTMTTAAAGRPQLMITNHPHNGAIASRLARTGAGRHLHIGEVPDGVAATADELRSLLQKPVFTEGAQRLGREIAEQPAPHDVVERLLAFC